MRCSPSGSPEALRNTVRVMPSLRAVRVIAIANRSSLPPSASASTVAASLAERVTRPMMASSTGIVSPARRPSLVGGMPAARLETLMREDRSSWPAVTARKVRYSVIILVSDAGMTESSALRAASTSPLR